MATRSLCSWQVISKIIYLTLLSTHHNLNLTVRPAFRILFSLCIHPRRVEAHLHNEGSTLLWVLDELNPGFIFRCPLCVPPRCIIHYLSKFFNPNHYSQFQFSPLYSKYASIRRTGGMLNIGKPPAVVTARVREINLSGIREANSVNDPSTRDLGYQ